MQERIITIEDKLYYIWQKGRFIFRKRLGGFFVVKRWEYENSILAAIYFHYWEWQKYWGPSGAIAQEVQEW